MAHQLIARDLHWNQIGPFDLDVRSGQCLGISGPSGSGKSVLLRMLADLVPHQGNCTLDGVDRADMPAPVWRQRVRYCAAVPGWWASTVGAHFIDPAAVARICARLGLAADLLEKSPDQLSTGERQRFGLLRAIEDEPDILLLDEPTSALDAAATAQVETLLSDHRAKGMGLVLVTHDVAQLQRLADTVMTVHKP